MYSYSFYIGIGQIEDEFIRKVFSLGVTKAYQIKKQMRKHNDENQNVYILRRTTFVLI